MNDGADDWGRAPDALGMRVTREGLVGTWNGRIQVRAAHLAYAGTSSIMRGPDDQHAGIWQEHEASTSRGTVITATLAPALQLGLGAIQRGPLDPGRSAPDQLFRLEGGDLERVRRVLAGPVMAEILRDATVGPPVFEGLELHDGYVQVRCAHAAWVTDPAVLGRGFAWVGRIAEALLARHAAERPAWEAALLASWPAVATRWGLAFDPAKHSMTGVVRGRDLTVVIYAGSGKLMTEVRVGFTRALGCTIELSREAQSGFFGGLLKKLGSDHDIEVGDPAFDKALLVRGDPANAVRAVLGPAARERLLGALAVFETMSLYNHGLAAWADLVLAPELLERMVGAAYAAAEALDAGHP